MTARSFEGFNGRYLRFVGSEADIAALREWMIKNNIRWLRGTALVSDAYLYAFFEDIEAAQTTRWWLGLVGA